MKAKTKPPVTAWSYSRFQDYRLCPLRFKFRHIDKIDQGNLQSPAMKRGADLHDLLEGYVLGYKKKLTKELLDTMGKPMKTELDLLKKQKAIPEQQAAFDREWNLVPWNDWDRAWLRVVIDLSHLSVANDYTARVIDYKSGKVKEAEHAEQLELYGIYGFLKFPDAKNVSGEPWYIDHGKMGAPLVFANRKKDLPMLQRKWAKLVEPMFRDRQFKATPSMACKWCPFSGRTGGPCKKG